MPRKLKIDLDILECIYSQYNKRELIHPDPLEFVYSYKSKKDREIVGLIASSLAYGRVVQILASVNRVLKPMGLSPCKFLISNNRKEIEETYKGFKHRFTTEKDLCDLLLTVKNVLNEFGSIESCFYAGYNGENDLSNAMNIFAKRFANKSGKFSLITAPKDGSACKRFNMYLRWMIRKDNVDPGGWHKIDKSKLIAPLDTHMYQICKKLGLTKSKQANFKTAVEVTNTFRKINPGDPVKYDFSLTRFGIRNDTDMKDLYKRCGIDA